MIRYFNIPYVKGGRDMKGLDCWGLVRLARVELFEREELPIFSSVDPLDKRNLTRSQIECVKDRNLNICDFKVGAIATGWRGRLCCHVGIVVEADGRLFILETDENTGVCLTTLNNFKSKYSKVVFYD